MVQVTNVLTGGQTRSTLTFRLVERLRFGTDVSVFFSEPSGTVVCIAWGAPCSFQLSKSMLDLDGVVYMW